MFGVGQTVLYGSNGVCTIDAVTKKQIGKNWMEYYVLKPVGAASSTLFVPTSNEQLVGKIRSVLTADEINALLGALPDCQPWDDNKQTRSDTFRAVIAAGDCRSLLQLIRQIHAHEQEQLAKGKRLHLSDERFLKEAEKMICEEFSLVLDIPRDEVLARILA